MAVETTTEATSYIRGKISVDQVVWLKASIKRYGETAARRDPGISRRSKGAALALLIEVMDILGLEFAEDAAAQNAISDFDELRRLWYREDGKVANRQG